MHERHHGRRDEDYRRARHAGDDRREWREEDRRARDYDYDTAWDRHGRSGHDIYVRGGRAMHADEHDMHHDHRHRDAMDEDGGERPWTDRAADGVKALFGSERAERRLRHDRADDRFEDRRDMRRRHDFRGVGPRARHDEDDELKETICQLLEDDPELDASDIIVRVIDNEAILDGTVRKKHDAELAYQLAREVPGVIHVRERLRIGRDRDDRVRRATVGMGYEEGRPRRRREWRS
jgi:osmotically-inducible protein OsmY